jgi:putative FmdB family regulatory protein
MPLYEHYCQHCDTITEDMCRIDDRKQYIPCSKCGGSAERIISAAIQRVEPTWLESAKGQLHADSRDKIRDRNDLQRHMRKECIVQVG